MSPEEQIQFDALAGELKIAQQQRDVYKNGFDTQTKLHEAAVAALKVAQAGYEAHLAAIVAENADLKAKLSGVEKPA